MNWTLKRRIFGLQSWTTIVGIISLLTVVVQGKPVGSV